MVVNFYSDSSQSNHRVLNKDYENDVKHTVQYTRWLLELIGIWPLVKKKPRKIALYSSIILIILCYFFLAFIMVPCLLHMIMREKNKMTKIKLLAPIGLRVTNVIKFSSLIVHRDLIRRCIEHVENDWMMAESSSDREIMMRNANVGRGLTILCGIFMYFGGMSYQTILPLLRGNKQNSINQAKRPLVYPGYDIFVDSQSSPQYEIIFYTTCVSAFAMYTIITGVCGLAALFVTHVCGQVEIIVSRLDTLFDDIENDEKNRDVLKQRVSNVVRCHARVLRLAAGIEQMFSEICLVEVILSTLMICLLEYYCLTEWEQSDKVAIITYVLLLISLSFNIFIFCHIGELLKEKCFQVGEATYMIDWYRLPLKTGPALIMVIAMANYPRKISAGRMMELSIASFGSIIKTSVMYLNMLRAFEE